VALEQNTREATEAEVKAVEEAQRYKLDQGEKERIETLVEDLRMLASQGNPLAMLQIANLNLQKKVPYPSMQLAFKYLEKAAWMGHPQSQYVLANAYLESKVAYGNIDSAIYWLKQAGLNGYWSAYQKLAKLYEVGTKDLLPNQKEAQKYHLLYAEHGQPNDLFIYAKNVFETQGPSRTRESLNMLQEAARLGSADAMVYLANVHDSGLLGRADPALAFKYYLEAANRKHRDALYEVAKRYESGFGTTKNIDEAKKMYIEAAHLFSKKAYFHAAWYLEQDGQLDKALHYYKSARANGNTEADKAIERVNQAKSEQAPKTTEKENWPMDPSKMFLRD
jgi:TPR repeat protein